MPTKKKSDCTPEEWAAHLEYVREWRLKNLEEQRAKRRAYYHRPEVRAKKLEYNALPSTKERKAARDTSPEARAAARARSQDAAAKERKRLLQKKRRTGFTEELVQILLLKQDGCCAICSTPFVDPKKIKSDHCHSTNSPRGLLCHSCNIIEGFMSRLPVSPEEFARRLVAYLENPPASEATQPSIPS